MLEYNFRDCELWFMHFSLNPMQTLLAVGTKLGQIFLWDVSVLQECPPGENGCLVGSRCRARITNPWKLSVAVRSLAFSGDGRFVV